MFKTITSIGWLLIVVLILLIITIVMLLSKKQEIAATKNADGTQTIETKYFHFGSAE